MSKEDERICNKRFCKMCPRRSICGNNPENHDPPCFKPRDNKYWWGTPDRHLVIGFSDYKGPLPLTHESPTSTLFKKRRK